MAEKTWLRAKTVKCVYQALPDSIISLDKWMTEKVILAGNFKEGKDWKLENGEYFLSGECEEALRLDSINSVIGESAERFERRNDPPQQIYAETGDPVWDEFIRW